MEKNMDENRMTEMFEKNCDLFSAAESVGNKAVDDLGYNQSYTFAPGLTATYELYTYGQRCHIMANTLTSMKRNLENRLIRNRACRVKTGFGQNKDYFIG